MSTKIVFLLPTAFVWALYAQPVVAGPADYVYTPMVEYGEKEIDFKYGSARQPDGTLRQVASLGVGYGAKEYWFTEVYFKRERNGNQESNLVEWENKFQLTEIGEYPLDLGFITELEAPLSSNAPWEVRLGPLLQSDFGRVQLNGNLLFERTFGKTDESGVPFSTNLGYQWQIKYRWQTVFEFGMQGLGEVGKWNNWSKSAEQPHQMGPAIFGKLPLGARQAIKYNAAWLMGVNHATPGHTVRMQAEYEF